jgi:hypothetical protein
LSVSLLDAATVALPLDIPIQARVTASRAWVN